MIALCRQSRRKTLVPSLPPAVAKHRQLAVGVLIGGVAMAGLSPAVAGTDSHRAGKHGDVVPRQIVTAPSSERLDKDSDVQRMARAVDQRRLRTTVTKLVSFGTRNTSSTQTDPDRGIGAAQDWVFDELSEIADRTRGRMDVGRQTHTRTIAGRSIDITNVFATLRGTEGGENPRTYIVTAHNDSRATGTNDPETDAPGANDDASGVAAVLESARIMSRYEFDADIIFMAVSGEEQGLYGADSFAREARAQGKNIEAVLNLDTIGNTRGGSGLSTPDRIRVFSEGVPWTETEQQANRRRLVGGENDGPSRQLARYINTVAETYTPRMDAWMINRVDRFGRGGDHRAFLQQGYTAVRFTEPFENYSQQHQDPRIENGQVYGDLIEFVDFDYLKRVNELVIASLASLANAPSVPDDVQIVTRGVDAYNTTVSWAASPESDIVGYEVVWRDTTSPVWTDSRFFRGELTRAEVVDLSKDNAMVGVRAVDRDGNRSPVALAR
jgi:hypothetical protein